MIRAILFSMLLGSTAVANVAGEASDFLQFVVTLYPYAAGADFKDTAVTQISVAGVTQITKLLVHETRPDGSDNRSFFSGHTSHSFASASMVCKYANTENCILSLALASTVGYLRVAAKKHWWRDVFVGAGVGFSPYIIWRF